MELSLVLSHQSQRCAVDAHRGRNGYQVRPADSQHGEKARHYKEKSSESEGAEHQTPKEAGCRIRAEAPMREGGQDNAEYRERRQERMTGYTRKRGNG